MVRQLRNFLIQPTSRDILINTVGNFLNVFFSILLVLVLTRIWNPETYGIFGVLFGIAYVLANILDFGTTATIYAHIPPLLETRREDLYKFVKSTFFFQSIFAISAVLFLCTAFPLLDQYFFKTDSPVIDLYLTALSVLFFIWQNFLSNCMFAAKQFLRSNIYLNITNIVKTVLLFAMIYTDTLTIGSVMLVYGILGPIMFFLLYFFQKKHHIKPILKATIDWAEFRFKYAITFFIASQFMNLGLRMDLFMLSHFQLKADVGYYAIAQKIILTILTVVISVTQVLSPMFAKLKTKSEVKKQVFTSLYYLLIPSSLFILLVITPDSLFSLAFTSEFTEAAPISKALSLPFLLYTLMNIPMLFLLYSVRKPRFILYAYFVFFVIMSLGCYYLVPLRGAYGPPYALAVAIVVSSVVLAIPAINEYKKLPAA